MSSNCLSCDVRDGKVKTPGGILFENELITITHSIPPAQCRGFLIVQPKRHTEHLDELTDEEGLAIARGIGIASKSLKKVLSPEKVYTCSFGESVKHVHFYVIPRSKEMPASGVKVLNEILKERKWECSEKEAEEVALKIKENLTSLS